MEHLSHQLIALGENRPVGEASNHELLHKSVCCIPQIV